MGSNDLEIKRFMAQKLAEKESLSQIQQEVNDKFGTRMTYMEIRILASELDDVDWKAFDPAPPKQDGAEDDGKSGKGKKKDAAAGAAGGTVVEVSKLVRPDTALSGTVKFRSGSTADWYVDSYGRLGIENLEGENPSEEDVREFQKELQKQLGR